MNQRTARSSAVCLAALAAVTAGWLASGCGTPTPRTMDEAVKQGILFTYYEYELDDRIYVMAHAEKALEFEENRKLQPSLTKVGAGPDGETVVIEIDEDLPELSDLLWA